MNSRAAFTAKTYHISRVKMVHLRHFLVEELVTLPELTPTATILNKLCLVIVINLGETHLEQKFLNRPTDRLPRPLENGHRPLK